MALQPFKDALPVPRVIKPKDRNCVSTDYEVRMMEFFHQFHSDLPPTKVWGYEGQLPGPTFEVVQGETTHIEWKNELPQEHFLPIDRTLHSCSEHMPDVRTVVHLHGAEVPPDSDGHPEAWYTADYGIWGPRFERKVYEYPNNQRAAALWYHDHSVGITRLNVYAGLAGVYIIRSNEERALNLPSGIYEVPLVIQDKSFNPDGSLFYPTNVPNPPPEFPEVSITPGFAGDTIIVNGKAWPYMEVEPRKYRFRVLNASNERFYRLELDSGLEFIQIGSDGGLLQKPVTLNELVVAPAERMDLVIDFSGYTPGDSVLMLNTARVPFDFGAPPDPLTTGLVMQFRIKESTSEDTSSVPDTLSQIKRFSGCDACRIRDITIDVGNDHYGRLLFTLGGHGYMEAITEDPIVGDVEIWRIINAGLGVHPIHIHQIQFQILDKIKIDVDAYNLTGQIRYTSTAEPPEANERGWKDVVQAPPGYITKLIMRFGPYTGRYIYHCHILEHEDNDMMRPIQVVPPCTPEQ